ncbi:Methylmalonyl-CoA carboxyltransferase 1.3S subunit [Austwickia sp. TVS 96-490-7B]|uniref:biotin/lipoyl-containing protein n=1 Tax=Austwickia sp. TVS 96-490-7B TaxID=2830843 RepID=UPI001C55FC8C|nr:biotin/lipoyl-containing protein [Austwickia sp. TVS 96-490-7B]MBW3086579.1 Methylmalonyl-CoA carboxyltransferase 1.3S subunit [Austwickia sp. TVS 96-490-7B]
MKLKVTVNGIEYDVDVDVEEEPTPTLGSIMVGSTSAYGVTPTAAKAPASTSNGLTAPISGTVVKILVDEGAEVKAGDTVMILEAMKMETEITAPADGTVATIDVSVGEAVQGGQVLLEWA